MSPEPLLEIISGGLQTTVQDLGRPGYRSQGVPLSGACDPASLALANRLAGNAPSAAGLECTLLGPTLEALTEVVIGVAGADLGATVEPAGRAIPPGRRLTLQPGERLVLGGPRGPGCRAYLAVDGGIDVPLLLGSRSTCLPGDFGGHEGRALQPGDRLHRAAVRPAPLGRRPVLPADPAERLDAATLPALAGTIRVLEAPTLSGTPHPGRFHRLTSAEWTVSPASDRRGLRLTGDVLPFTEDARAGSRPIVPGSIQLTPEGTLILILPDGGTTGGYPVIALVIGADLRLAGQARPGDLVRFRPVDLPAALNADARARQDGLLPLP